MEIFCSTIIPTIGRDSLNQSVASVLSQELSQAQFEVIVVNDSGKPLPSAGWQSAENVKIIETAQRERSVARNTGATLASGRYLHFLDDDDWLAPGALRHLWNLSQASQAKWLYGITQLVDREHKLSLRLQHGLNGNCFVQVMAGEWIPLQASLIEAKTFFEVGGFNPLLCGPEDIDLLRRIALVGEVAETPNLIAYIVRGEQGSTTDYRNHPQARRWAREIILNSPGVLNRLRLSAHTPAWQGRIARIYLTSMIWNIQQGRFLTSLSRLLFGLAGIATTGGGCFISDYWRAFSRPYASETFERGAAAAGVQNVANYPINL